MKPLQLVHKNEKLYFALLVIASVLMISLAIVLTIVSFGMFLWAIVAILGISLFTHWLQIGYIRTNGVKVTERQFSDLHQTYKRVGQEMGIRLLPDVYILQAGGVLNAFATRFFQKNMVILYSDIVELSRDGYAKEVDFILAHELAHIRRSHVQKQWVTLLGGWIPFLGTAYSRACEYTCDQMAAHYVQDTDASKRALTILAVGGKLAKEVNEFDYLYEASRENGFIAKYSELLSTHPTLPKRIAAIAKTGGTVNIPTFKTAGYVKASIVSTIVVGILVNASLVAWFVTSDGMMGLSEVWSSETDVMSDEPIQQLAYDDAPYEDFVSVLDEGADINTQDGYGDTPLHNLLYSEDVDLNVVTLLLDHGADPSLENEDGMTPAELAVENGHGEELVQLIYSYE